MIDRFNAAILRLLQRDGTLTQRALAELVNLSPNACWNRVQALKKAGVITGQTTRLDREKLGLDLVVFVMVRTRHHSLDWLKRFRAHVSTIPEVIDFFRIGGDYDYLLKVVVASLADYETFMRRRVHKLPGIASLDSSFAFGEIKRSTVLPG